MLGLVSDKYCAVRRETQKQSKKGRGRMSFDFSAIMIILKGKADGGVGGGWGENSDAALINRIITEVKSAGLCFLPL